MYMKTVEFLFLGNELLIGRTVNTNLTYLAREVTKHGFYVARATTIRDDLNQAVATINEIRSRKPDVVIIGGGLGPTHDDIQLLCLATALNKPLIVNQDALAKLEAKYKKRGIELTNMRKKMIELPEGSIPLNNSIGSAPGVLTIVDGNYWFSLPGVPRELKAIFSEKIVPYLDKLSEGNKAVEFGFTASVPEAIIAEITRDMDKQYSDISFKTHPRKKEGQYWIALHVYGYASEERTLEACQKWRDLVAPLSKEVSEIHPVFTDDFEPEKEDI